MSAAQNPAPDTASTSLGSRIISEVKISGNRLVSTEEISNIILAREGQVFNRDLVMSDLQSIFTMGYFKAESIETVPYLKDDGTMVLEYKVEENPPITDLIIYGSNDIQEVDPYSFFADLIAKPENARLIKDRIKELETAYIKKGYIVAKVKDIELSDSGRLSVFIDEGVVNEVAYQGNLKTQRDFLDHLISKTQVGKPYNEFEFAKDFRRLQGTGYFSNVNRTVRPSDNSDGYKLIVELKEKSTTSIGAGGGINSNAGVFGNANLQFGNLRGKGESLNINALIGTGFGAGSTLDNDGSLVRSDTLVRVGTSYNIPYFLGSQYNFRNSINFSKGPNFNVDLSRQTLVNLGSALSRRVGDDHFFSLGVTGNYIDISDRDRAKYIREVSRNIVEVDNLSQAEILKKQGNNFTGGRRAIARKEAKRIRDEQIVDGVFLGIRPRYRYTTLDNPQRPRDGWKVRVSASPNLGFGDIGSYTKFNASTTRYFPVGQESSFLVNFRGGYDVVGDIPQFDKYRLGGTAAIRGYRQFSELGIGDRLLISTAEFRTPIYNVISPLKRFKYSKNVDFAVFADAGLIGGNIRLNRITNRLSQAASVGFGLRVKLPLVGALRVDVGFPLIEALTSDRLFRFNFGPADFF